MPEWLKKIIEIMGGKKVEELTPEDLLKIQENVPAEPKKPENEPSKNEESKLILQRLDAMSASQAEALKKQEAAEKALQEQMKKERTDKIAAEIKAAKAEGKIKAQNEEDANRWIKRFETDFDDAKLLLSQIPATITGNENGSLKNTQQTTTLGKSRSELMDDAKAAFKNV